MPGTGHNAVFNKAAAERRAHMRADIVDCIVPALMKKHGNQLALELDRLAFVFCYLTYLADGSKLAHNNPRAEKGVRPHLPERPFGCFAQMGPDPFFRPKRTGSMRVRLALLYP